MDSTAYYALQKRIFEENGLADLLDVSRETSNGTKTVAELLCSLTERLSAVNAVIYKNVVNSTATINY